MVFACVSLGCAALPFLMTLANLRLFRRESAPKQPYGEQDRVDLCVPMRDEQRNINECLRSVLASRGVSVRALVYDDHSTDNTPQMLRAMIASDARVCGVPTVALPPNWNGKQWGCQCMGCASDAKWLLFTDADVRLQPDAIATAVKFANRSGSDLVSTVPRQICATLGEALVVPLIHFMLLGYLPMGFMRRDGRASLGAGCGQFLLIRREIWLKSGGHAAFASSMHDGIMLPRSVRRSGGRTDLFDCGTLVTCRMYRGMAQTWRGFTKNAYEGLGSVTVLLFFTMMHLLGHVAPWCMVAAAMVGVPVGDGATMVAIVAIVCGLFTRVLLARRFGQPWIAVALHPLCMLLLTMIQWRSAWLARTGRRAWRGRLAGA